MLLPRAQAVSGWGGWLGEPDSVEEIGEGGGILLRAGARRASDPQPEISVAIWMAALPVITMVTIIIHHK